MIRWSTMMAMMLLAVAAVSAAEQQPPLQGRVYLEQPSAAAVDGPARPAPDFIDPSLVREVQTRLRAAGYDAGGIDGVPGPQTQAALMSFQHANGLTATGRLDLPTLSALEIGGIQQGAGQDESTPRPAPR